MNNVRSQKERTKFERLKTRDEYRLVVVDLTDDFESFYDWYWHDSLCDYEHYWEDWISS